MATYTLRLCSTISHNAVKLCYVISQQECIIQIELSEVEMTRMSQGLYHSVSKVNRDKLLKPTFFLLLF